MFLLNEDIIGHQLSALFLFSCFKAMPYDTCKESRTDY